MLTSNINEILIKNQIQNNLETKKNDEKFIDSLLEDKKEQFKTTQLTYENIKNISLEDIDTIFENDDKKSIAKNLKLATMFSNDEYLSKALFDTVMGKPFNIGYTYLFDMYEDKNSFLNSSNNSLSKLLEKTVSNRFDKGEMKITDKISQDKLDEILTTVNSFSFVKALSSGYKDLNDRYYDDKDNQYSFLYNDFYLKYQQLEYKYKDLKEKNDLLLNQFK